ARVLHSWAMTPQQRSAAPFSGLGDSAVTTRRSVASISGKRGFKKRRNSLGEWKSGRVRRCYPRDAPRAMSQSGAQEEILAIDQAFAFRARDVDFTGERVSRRAGLRI